ncbi:MAG TPA: OB-fold nucleic acid binding domain-containing protein [Candidatus Limnocylindrales bacterium]|nr:OB-fold nucleic acid binding domain-containing protein [Candidatus Limnocylindrales bacterium]
MGALEGGRGAFVQDATAGIAVLLDAAPTTPVPAGRRVRIEGTVDDRYSQRTLRATGFAELGEDELPEPVVVGTGSAGEPLEGSRVAISGTITEGPDPLAEGVAITVDDGSGPLRVVLAAGLLEASGLARGDRVTAVGPLGQRDSSGTGLAGYRLHVTLASDVSRLTPDPSPSPSGSPWPTASPSAAPSPSPSTGPDPRPIAEARTAAAGTLVRVRGVVTAAPGRLAKPALVPIDDGTAGILVRLPDEALVERGDRLDVTGKLADPYGQLEIRLDGTAGLVVLGPAPEPLPMAVVAADLGEPLEARLVSIDGRLRRVERSTAGTVGLDLDDPDGVPFRAFIDPSTGVSQGDLVTGAAYRIIGVVGQRSSRSGAMDGYRVWLREGEDLAVVDDGAAAPPNGTPGPSPSPDVVAIETARSRIDATLVIEGIVTAGPTLLDGSGKRVIVQDATAAVEVLLPMPGTWAVGDRIRATGTMGVAYGAPRLRATGIDSLGRGELPVPVDVAGTLGDRLEWRLARARGSLSAVHRLGDRWRAELQLPGGVAIPLAGLAGADIDPDGLRAGIGMTVVGIVRRAYPTAADQRLMLVPRGAADLRPDPGGAPANGAGTGDDDQEAAGPGSGSARGRTARPGGAPLIELATLGEHVGEEVRVSGIVVAVDGPRVSMDDGSAVGILELRGAAERSAADLRAGDALAARGRVDPGPTGPRVIVEDPTAIVVAGGLVPAIDGPADPGYETAAPGPLPERTTSSEAPLAVLAMSVGILAAALGGGVGLAASRRRRERRRWATRMTTRLRAIAADRPAGTSPAAAGGHPVRIPPGAPLGSAPALRGPTLGPERGDSA